VGAAVVAAVLAAAFLHAVWNALAHNIRDTLAGFVLICIADTVCAAAIVAVVGLPAPRAWPFIVVSAVLEVLYFLALLQAYRLGEFGQMYPIARGTSPFVVAVVATTVLGQALAPAELVGVLVISAGLIGLAFAGPDGRSASSRTGGLPGRAQLPALAAAVGTGVLIASYTIVDGVGVRRSGDVLAYIGWIFLLQGPVLPLLALARYGRALPGRLRPFWIRGLAGGVISMLAYGLVVWAQSRGALAPIAALREVSIVIATIIGTIIFKERFGRVRLVASIAVVAGILLLNLT
jgi:drug/metabolite transporter (DMT)-like permease